MGFADSIKASSVKILKEIDRHCYRVSWHLFTGTIQDSPVLKGELINNWFPAVNSFSTETTSVSDKGGSGSLSRVNSFANQGLFYGKDVVFTLSNNLHYAYNAEQVGWPSPQWSGRVGPYKMIHKNMIKIKAMFP